jgi:hypothetical protein
MLQTGPPYAPIKNSLSIHQDSLSVHFTPHQISLSPGRRIVGHPEADNEVDHEDCHSDTYDRQKQIEPHIVSSPKLFFLGGLVHKSNFLSACNGVDEFSRRLPDNYLFNQNYLT